MRTFKLVSSLLVGVVGGGLLAMAVASAPALARSHPAAGPTEPPAAATPAPFGTVDGTWEVQLQRGSATIYSDIYLLARGEGVGGRWTRDRAVTAVSGGLTGDRFSFSGTDVKGPFTLTGYIENSASMIGLFAQNGKTTPFTATHKGLPASEMPPKQHRGRGKHAKTVKVEPGPSQAQQPAAQTLPQSPTLPQTPQTQPHQ